MENFDGDHYLSGLIFCVEDIYNNTDDGLFKIKAKLGNEYESNLVVAQYGEERCNNNDQNDDTRIPEGSDQHVLTQLRYILFNDIINRRVR